MTSPPDDLNNRLMNWLEGQGYLFEMAVARHFQKAGFAVSLGDPYTDFDTHLEREIDVSAHRRSDPERRAVLTVTMRVECKSSRDKPWVVFHSGSEPNPIFPFQFVCSSACRLFLVDAFKSDELRGHLSSSPLLNPPTTGYGLVQGFKDQQDVAHAAFFGSAKASVDLVSRYDAPEIVVPFLDGPYNAGIAFPAILIDAPLFECFLSGEGEPSLETVDISWVAWRASNPIHGTAVVPIVTLSAIDQLVSLFDHASSALIACVDERPDLLQSASEEFARSLVRRTGFPPIG